MLGKKKLVFKKSMYALRRACSFFLFSGPSKRLCFFRLRKKQKPVPLGLAFAFFLARVSLKSLWFFWLRKSRSSPSGVASAFFLARVSLKRLGNFQPRISKKVDRGEAFLNQKLNNFATSRTICGTWSARKKKISATKKFLLTLNFSISKVQTQEKNQNGF